MYVRCLVSGPDCSRTGLDEVYQDVWVAEEEAVRDLPAIKKLGITHVLNVAAGSGPFKGERQVIHELLL